jgi:hypothetical protein
MEKLNVHEIRPDGEISTVGLFYSRGEAEHIIAQLRCLPENKFCRYEIAEAVTHALSMSPRRATREAEKE